jgi:hypothetical protein
VYRIGGVGTRDPAGGVDEYGFHLP